MQQQPDVGASPPIRPPHVAPRRDKRMPSPILSCRAISVGPVKAAGCLSRDALASVATRTARIGPFQQLRRRRYAAMKQKGTARSTLTPATESSSHD
jgi:hypothetical protein